MAVIGTAKLILEGDSGSFQRAMRAASKTFSGLNSSLEATGERVKKQFSTISDSTLSAGAAFRLLGGATALGFAAKKMFETGAAVEETSSKFATVMGPAIGSAQGFLERFANSAGLTTREGQELLATTAGIAQGMGFGQAASSGFAQEIVELSADLGSFNNQPTAEVAAKIQAALTGERESLKSLGIVISETDVQQAALAATGKKSADSLTQQEKATATLNLITQRAGVAVGDLARTMDSPANRARKLTAQLLDVRDGVTQALLPAFGVLLQELNSIAGAHGFEGLGDAMRANASRIAAWTKFAVESFKTVGLAIAAPIRIAFNLGQVLGRTLEAFAQLKVGRWKEARETFRAIGGDVGDIGDAVGDVVRGFDDMREASGEAWMTFSDGEAAVKPVSQAVANLATQGSTLGTNLRTSAEDAARAFDQLFSSLVGVSEAGIVTRDEAAKLRQIMLEQRSVAFDLTRSAQERLEAYTRTRAAAEALLAAERRALTPSKSQLDGLRLPAVGAVKGVNQPTAEGEHDALRGVAAQKTAETTAQVQAFEKYSETVKVLRERLAAGSITLLEFRAGFVAAEVEFARATETVAALVDPLEVLGDRMQDIALRGADAIADFAMGSEDAIKDFVKAALADLARLLARMLLIKALGSIFPGSGFVAGLAGGLTARERGGPVHRGQRYLVGEKGPELFIPREAGTIIPADRTHRMARAGELLSTLDPSTTLATGAEPLSAAPQLGTVDSQPATPPLTLLRAASSLAHDGSAAADPDLPGRQPRLRHAARRPGIGTATDTVARNALQRRDDLQPEKPARLQRFAAAASVLARSNRETSKITDRASTDHELVSTSRDVSRASMLAEVRTVDERDERTPQRLARSGVAPPRGRALSEGLPRFAAAASVLLPLLLHSATPASALSARADERVAPADTPAAAAQLGKLAAARANTRMFERAPTAATSTVVDRSATHVEHESSDVERSASSNVERSSSVERMHRATERLTSPTAQLPPAAATARAVPPAGIPDTSDPQKLALRDVAAAPAQQRAASTLLRTQFGTSNSQAESLNGDVDDARRTDGRRNRRPMQPATAAPATRELKVSAAHTLERAATTSTSEAITNDSAELRETERTTMAAAPTAALQIARAGDVLIRAGDVTAPPTVKFSPPAPLARATAAMERRGAGEGATRIQVAALTQFHPTPAAVERRTPAAPPGRLKVAALPQDISRVGVGRGVASMDAVDQSTTERTSNSARNTDIRDVRETRSTLEPQQIRNDVLGRVERTSERASDALERVTTSMASRERERASFTTTQDTATSVLERHQLEVLRVGETAEQILLRQRVPAPQLPLRELPLFATHTGAAFRDRGAAARFADAAGIAQRATGGPVRRNTPYLVGERGPELFMPPASGKIISHEKTTRLLAATSPASNRAASPAADAGHASGERAIASSGGIPIRTGAGDRNRVGDDSRERAAGYDRESIRQDVITGLSERVINRSGDGGRRAAERFAAAAGIPQRAAGGPVQRGAPYLVGERGPELFVPPASGKIISHEKTTRLLSRVELGADPARQASSSARAAAIIAGAHGVTVATSPTSFNTFSGDGSEENSHASNAIDGIGVPGVEFRARGGPVRKDRPYIVGERGAELFMAAGQTIGGARGARIPDGITTGAPAFPRVDVNPVLAQQASTPARAAARFHAMRVDTAAIAGASLPAGGYAEQHFAGGAPGSDVITPASVGDVSARDGLSVTLRMDSNKLPPRPQPKTPDALAMDDWWRQAFSHLILDWEDRSGGFRR